MRPHTPISINGEALAYDSNGNLLSRGTRSYGYDGENRLTSVNGSVFFAYGPDGERIKKTGSFGSTIYLGPDIEYASGVYTKYLHSDVKLAAGIASYLHRDHLNSIRLETDASDSLSTFAYLSFGAPLQVTPSKGYIGERYDQESGLMHLHARYYDPALSRFIQPDSWDPTEPGVGTNRYAYAENRLTSVNASVFYAYGPDGERIKKTGSFGSTIYLGNDVEYANGAYTKYIHPDVKLAAGITTYLHRDHLNSIRLETDASDSSSTFAYLSFGAPLQVTPSKGYIGERRRKAKRTSKIAIGN